MELAKLIKAFGYVTSENRDEALANLIEYVVYTLDSPQDIAAICDFIKLEFDVQFDPAELKSVASQMLKKGNLERIADAKFKLSDSRVADLRAHSRSIALRQEERQKRIGKYIDEIDSSNLAPEVHKKILISFTQYMYECFYEYGRRAVNIISGELTEVERRTKHQILKPFIDSFSPNEKRVFTDLVEHFTDVMNSDDLDYLQKLAYKAELFFSLGMDKETYERASEFNFMDWVVFLDTNFLYSILNLHKHDEDDACNQIVRIIRDHKLNIRLTYIPDTRQELLNKKKDFDKNIARTSFTKHQISALLSSGNLDGFSKKYYEQKLEYGDETPHPTEIIDHHIASLKEKGVLIYNSNFKSLREESGYQHIINETSAFKEYEKFRNETRVEKGLDYKQPKDDHLLEHDVFLREAILFLRGTKAVSMNDVKYYGLTLDKTLIGFDKYRLRSDRTVYVPVFFLPSFLLGKLLRFIPLPTDDYKKAFISALSSTAFDTNSNHSVAVQQSAQKFKLMGINDERVMLSCMADNVFLEQFSQLEESEQVPFIESQLNRKHKSMHDEMSELRGKLEEREGMVSEVSKISASKDEDLKRLKARIKVLEEDQGLFIQELKKLTTPKAEIRTQPETPLFSDTQDSNFEEAVESELEEEGSEINSFRTESSPIQKGQYYILALMLIIGLPIIVASIMIKEYIYLAFIGVPTAVVISVAGLFFDIRKSIKTRIWSGLLLVIIYTLILFSNWNLFFNPPLQ
ncbi:hypothetical protein [Roseivirga spongicola]|uniref:PIN like domain-containing protein n=1 Tax=Roseivirga spongicola TaxID=333140 RepID=A0A150X9C7_9BACT|nr:hypothetical protein [Roseivirga spongicola]KYG75262.1 hypothetical protein AWW68_10695 [Roseivirga spongicola]WPZ08619.1 hypothetical protein T7867_10150 [Roseivirga spongicola]